MMPLSLAFILVFGLGWLSGVAWVRASRADKSERLVAQIMSLKAERVRDSRALTALRAELSEHRLRRLVDDIWQAEDDAS